MQSKQLRVRFFHFPQKKIKILFLFKINKKRVFLKKNKKTRWVVFFWKKPGFFSTLGGEFIPVSNSPRTEKVRWNSNILLLLHVEYEKDLSWFVIRFPLCGVFVTEWYWLRQSNRLNYSILVCCVCSQAFADW